MRHFSLCGIALIALLAGCSRDDLLDKFTNDAEKARAVELIEAVRRNDVAKIEPVLDPRFKNAGFEAQLEKVSRIMPAGEPTERKLVGVHVNTEDGLRAAQLVYQYRFADRYFFAACTTHEKDGKYSLYGITIEQRSGPYEAAQGFADVQKTPLHYVFMLSIIAFCVLSLAALVFCIMDRTLRRKWLWILFILIGLTTFSLNWNTGEWTFHAFHFLLFSAGVATDEHGRWIVSFSLPIGAAVYMLRRRRNQFAPTLSNETGSDPT